MKKIELEQLENIEGGWLSLGQGICGAGFVGYAALISYGLAFAPVSAGVSVGVAAGIGLIGVAVCGFVE